jgi:glycosyltransferase involved in cell wall biosynthesis
MNILYICSDSGIPVLGRKGASIHVRHLAGAFTRAGHSVVLATPLLTKSPWEPPDTVNAQVLHIPVPETDLAALDSVREYTDALGTTPTLPGELRRLLYNQHLEAKLLRRFRDAPPDFVYERAAVFGTAGVSVARTWGVPLVVELNAPLGLEQATYRGSLLRDLAAAAERRTLSNATLVLTVSGVLRDYVVDQGVDPHRVVVMPNGVDEDLFRPGISASAARVRWGIGTGPVLGFVGGLRPWHGVRAFVPLLARLAPRYPSIRLVIAGDGPLRQELTVAFAERGLDRHVVFTGTMPHSEVADLVRTFDLALAPYEDTSHLFYFSPLKLFEYMGCGVAVVAASIGQIGEVIRDGENGVLYEAGDVDGLTRCCEQLIDNPARRERLGCAAARTIHGSYTWRHNADRVVDLVRQARVQPEVLA